MKKFLIGCFGLFVLLAIGGSVATYFFVIKPGMQFAQEFAQLGQEFEQANANIDNQSSFTPPANEELTQSGFDRYLAAQQQIRTQIADRLQQLETKYEAFDTNRPGGEQPSIGDIVGAYADFGGLLMDAKRAQVEALNAQDFSLQEYNWTRTQVYRALGQQLGAFVIGDEFSLEQLVNAQAENEAQQPVPQSNIDMVEPHREQLMEMLALAWWGL